MRKKKPIAEMHPVKKWLSANEACSYLNLGRTKFDELTRHEGLTVSALNKTRYYRVSELDQLLEDNIIIRKL